jgi:2'-5' RNA ligase
MKTFHTFIHEINLFESYNFSSVQVRLDDETSKQVLDFADSIPDELIGPDGRETRPHITIKYGLHTDDVEKVKALPLPKKITAVMGKTSLFSNADADVLKIEINSPDLVNLNKIIRENLENTDTFPDYIPHATIAYLKPAHGKAYVNDSRFEGKKLVFDFIEFSPKGNNIYIPIPLSA